MSVSTRLKQLVPIAVSLGIIAMAAHVLMGTLSRIHFTDVISTLRGLPITALLIGGLLVVGLYSALTFCEIQIAQFMAGPVSRRRAALALLLAAPIGHAVGWGAVSGGAIRYRLYSAVGVRPLDIGKMVLLASIPYPAALGLLLGLSLVLQSAAAAAILHISEPLARGTGIALLALHLAYLTLIAVRRGPLSLGRFMLTLPSPQLTTMQYCVGIAEVCSAAGVLYVLLPSGINMPFVVFLGIYVMCILTALASSVPAGIGVFESMILLLMPHIAPAALLGRVIAYRLLLEVLPLLLSLALFLIYEVWWRLSGQRARVIKLRSAGGRS